MIRGRVINQAASLNQFKYIGSVEFSIGDSGLTLNFQLWDPQLEMRYIPPSTAIVKVTFNNFDTTTFQKIASFVDAGDRSLVQVQLATADLAQLQGGNLNFTVDVLGDGTQIINGIIFNALQQIIQDIPLL